MLDVPTSWEEEGASSFPFPFPCPYPSVVRPALTIVKAPVDLHLVMSSPLDFFTLDLRGSVGFLSRVVLIFSKSITTQFM